MPFADRSDGTVRPGPYRRHLAEALKDLQELGRCQQRKGDQAMLKELHKRDTDAMVAFYVELLEQENCANKAEKGAGSSWQLGWFGGK